MSSFPGVRSDFDSLNCGLALCEVIATALPYEGESDEYLDLLIAGLGAFGPGADPYAVLVWTLVRFLDLEGHSVQWSVFQDTGKPLDVTPVCFSMSRGGVISSHEELSPNDLIWISAQAAVCIDKARMLDAPPTAMKDAGECLRILVDWVAELLERPLPTCRATVRASTAAHV